MSEVAPISEAIYCITPFPDEKAKATEISVSEPSHSAHSRFLSDLNEFFKKLSIFTFKKSIRAYDLWT